MSRSPHDALFRATFSDVEEAAPLLRSLLPAEVADAIDWSSLRLAPSELVDEALAERAADLLFAAELGTGEAILVQLLLEHQSRFDPWMPFRLLEYIVRIWQRHRQEVPDAIGLPLVIPIVVAHDEGGWVRVGVERTELRSLYAAPPEVLTALEPHLVSLRFVLDDLSQVEECALASRGLGVFGQLVLQALRALRRSADPLADLVRWLPTLAEVVASPGGLPKLSLLLHYLYASTDVDRTEVSATLARLGEGPKTMAITTADRLRDEGRAEGREEGRVELLLAQLRTKFGEAVEAHVRARLDAADTATLERWGTRLLSADRLDEVFGDDADSPAER